MILTPICMVRQWGEFLKLHVNSFLDGHTTLQWVLVGSDIENSIDLEQPDVTLDGFKTPGVYSFWTTGPGGNSIRMNVYIRCDSSEAILKRIIGYITNQRLKERWALLILSKLQQNVADDPRIPIAEILYRQMNGSTKLQDYEKDLYKELLIMAEKYYNTSNIAMNSDLKSFPSIIYGGKMRLKFKADISKVRINEILPNGMTKYLPPCIPNAMSFENVFDIPAAEDTFIQVTPLAQDEISWLNHFIHYQFDGDTAASLWSDAVNANALLDQIILEDMSLFASDIEMSAADKQNWLLAQSKTPYDYIMPRPEILSVTDDYCQVKVVGYDFIKKSGLNFFVSTREEDLLLRNDFDNLTLIDDEIISIDRAKNYVDGNTFFYIQAYNDAIVSPLTRHDFRDDVSSLDFRDKARLLQFDFYERRLKNIIRYYIPTAEQYVTDILQRLRTIPESDIDEIYLYLLSETVKSYPESKSMNKLLFSIMEDWNSSFNVDLDFFPNDISYYYATDQFVFPGRKDDYMLCVGSIDHGATDNTPSMQYLHSKDSQSISIQTRNMKYYFMYAIDLSTFHRSGFLLIDTYNHIDPVIYRSNITFERR